MKNLSAEKSYNFTDFIRFVAMCAIIFQHSFIVDKAVLLSDAPSVVVFFFLKVLAKIGSISFFVVSGFLLAGALKRYSSKTYLNKRVKNIIKPYVLFFGIYLLLDSLGAFFGEQRITSFSEFPAFVISKVLSILFFTSYWFIFNYFISVMLLLALRKYLYERWLGVLLMCCTCVYAVNVHFEWFLPHHTTAFVGFTFFLWLGANLNKIEDVFLDFIEKTSVWKFVTLALLALVVNFYETFYLLQNAATVVDSSLKFTNILYALSVFLLLCKLSKNVQFKYLNPREETYPLYLVHPIFLKVINYAMLPMLPAVARIVTLDTAEDISWLMILVYQIGWFAFIYLLSLGTVKLILSSSFQWVFGKSGKVTFSPVQSFRLLINGVRNLKF
jgi:probable poly-beta-1,6-N-acetyl-D-glucosamine export protein